MAKQYEETGIVQADIAEFDTNTAKPDTIDDILKEKDEKEVISIAPLKPLSKIRDAFIGLLEKNSEQVGKFYMDTCAYLPVIVNASFSKINNPGTSFRMLLQYTEDTNRDFLKKYLVQEFGDSITDTDYLDIFEKYKNNANKELYLALFPELQTFPIMNREIIMTENPYLFVLRAHVQRRAFYAGVLEQAEKEKLLEIRPLENASINTVTNAAKLLTTKRILQYAKKVGEKNVLQYLEEIPKITAKIQ